MTNLLELPHLEAISTPYPVNEAPEGSNVNVIDSYKKFTTEQVRADLDTRRTSQIHIVVNSGHDFNVSTLIRSANAFNVRAVVVANRRKYDARGQLGTRNYIHARYAESELAAIQAAREDGYTIFAVDNILEKNPESIYDVALPEKSCFVYGCEGEGLTDAVMEACDRMVWIPQYGSVRSLNLAVSASLMMFEYCRQWPLENHV